MFESTKHFRSFRGKELNPIQLKQLVTNSSNERNYRKEKIKCLHSAPKGPDVHVKAAPKEDIRGH